MRDEFKNNCWFKRYLPHYNTDQKYQMITYRLADSLPQKIVRNLGAPQDSAGAKDSDLERRKITEENLDKGFGSCLLGIPEVAEEVVENWKYFHGIKYELITYVVMPNHVHVLIKVINNHQLSKIVWGWKTQISKFVNKRSDLYEKFLFFYEKSDDFNGYGTAPDERKRHLKPAKSCGAPGNSNSKVYKPSIWHREYWDRFIRNENHFKSALNYIHQNPVKAGLVKNDSDWQWSSAAIN